VRHILQQPGSGVVGQPAAHAVRTSTESVEPMTIVETQRQVIDSRDVCIARACLALPLLRLLAREAWQTPLLVTMHCTSLDSSFNCNNVL
jgi:hypothetical protein